MTTYTLHPSGILVGSDGSIWKSPSHKKAPRKQGDYRTVRVGNSSNRLVHHLVLEAFVGPRQKGYVGHHKDGNTLNNSLDNLMYVPAEYHNRGFLRTKAKLTTDLVREIRLLHSKGLTMADISRRLKVSYYLTVDVIRKKSWTWVE